MATFEQNCGWDQDREGKEPTFKMTFNTASGQATLEGSIVVPDIGYSYTLTPSQEQGSENETHLDLTLIQPGIGLASCDNLSIRGEFSVSSKISDIYVHVKTQIEEEGETLVHCRIKPGPSPV